MTAPRVAAMARAAAALVVVTVLPPAPATASDAAGTGSSTSDGAESTASESTSDGEQRMLALVAQERASAGLPGLRTASDITSSARAWSKTMASGTGLAHDPNLGNAVCCWKRLAENVGRTNAADPVAAADRIQAGFMGSSGHRANILDAEHTDIGVGMAIDADGRTYITVRFRTPKDAPPDPDPPPEDPPSEEPSPDPPPKKKAPTDEPAGQPPSSPPAESDGGPASDPEPEPKPGPEPAALTHDERAAIIRRFVEEYGADPAEAFLDYLYALGQAVLTRCETLLSPVCRACLTDFTAPPDRGHGHRR